MKRKTKEINPVSCPLLAWRYKCPCGLVAYSFDPYQAVQRLTCGHNQGKLTRIIYFQGKYHNHCPVCDFSANSHKGERKDETFYEAICPTKEKE